MKNYQTIAVGTDGSDSALEAVRTAASLARVYQSKLVVICAYYRSSGSLLDSPQADPTATPVVSQQQAREILAEAAEAATEEGAENVDLEDRSGSAVEVLVALLEEVNADLLVVGNRGINSLTGRLLGSVPADVARQSDCDVMIVHTVS